MIALVRPDSFDLTPYRAEIERYAHQGRLFNEDDVDRDAAGKFASVGGDSGPADTPETSGIDKSDSPSALKKAEEKPIDKPDTGHIMSDEGQGKGHNERAKAMTIPDIPDDLVDELARISSLRSINPYCQASVIGEASTEAAKWLKDNFRIFNRAMSKNAFAPIVKAKKSEAKEAAGKVLGSASKVYLDVPYERKDEAKRLGAKWDADRKKWVAPDQATADKINAELGISPSSLKGQGGDYIPAGLYGAALRDWKDDNDIFD